ncbi:hypothetical protein [Paenibacillus pseudetheri]|uniref:Uncharacterized protein n=1 Tax=Paenibacillus pseudetheri TaxID=2897682 RepID=A0ABM9BHB9_9BACL|nr:hypothetical protein [Paenibacillus pseudetheri]CAH1057806.1 hypothetical protein PAECIP111894_03979 [Paenibacillus pseudetheri]
MKLVTELVKDVKLKSLNKLKNRGGSHIDISMSLQPHGWLDVMIYTTEGEKIEIPVSFLSDAIHEIASKTSSLGLSDNDVIITVQTEPGEYRFKISKITKDLSLFNYLK